MKLTALLQQKLPNLNTTVKKRISVLPGGAERHYYLRVMINDTWQDIDGIRFTSQADANSFRNLIKGLVK